MTPKHTDEMREAIDALEYYSLKRRTVTNLGTGITSEEFDGDKAIAALATIKSRIGEKK